MKKAEQNNKGMFRVDIERKLISKTSLMGHMTRVK